MAKDSILKQTGVTEDGSKVFSGILKFYETHGLPLFFVFELLDKINAKPDLYMFYYEAIEAEWQEKTIAKRLRESVVDFYGKAHWNEVASRMKHLFLDPSLLD